MHEKPEVLSHRPGGRARTRHRRGRRRALAALLLAFILCFPALAAAPAAEGAGEPPSAPGAGDAAEPAAPEKAQATEADAEAKGGPKVEDTRAAIEKWVETRKIISKENRDWTLGREVLNERIGLVEREVKSVRDKIREAEASIAEADKKRAELAAANDRLKSASAALGRTVVSLEQRTRTLLKRLPEPIRERVKPLSQRFPEDPNDTRLSLSERFQNIVGILNEVNKFNREITVTPEVRRLDGGQSAEVTTVYVGIGQAYYASADGRMAGVGTATEDGWLWKPANEAAPEIARVIAILKNEEVASFVRLPIETE